MLPISEIPVCLREFAEQFRKVFNHPAQREHFEEILIGLIASDNRTVAGIQQKLLSPTEYDSLNHFMTDSPWSHDELRKHGSNGLARIYRPYKAVPRSLQSTRPLFIILAIRFMVFIGFGIMSIIAIA